MKLIQQHKILDVETEYMCVNKKFNYNISDTNNIIIKYVEDEIKNTAVKSTEIVEYIDENGQIITDIENMGDVEIIEEIVEEHED